jgi:outer membrane protein assembly factor BamE (lipoprotein component of BamABCDE complex)
MTQMKSIKIISLFILTVFAIWLFLFYQDHYSDSALKGHQNIESVTRVKKGMTKDNVNSIMGTPDLILDSGYQSTQFLYNTNDDSFAHVRVIFDSTMTVKDVETYQPKTN